MPLYRKLRGALAEQGKHLYDMADYLNYKPMSISLRMTGKTPWRMDEAYRVMDFLSLPRERIFDYFPPDGKVAP